MNPEPTDRRDAESLDAFWDELVLDQLTGRIPRAASSANEEMVMNLRSLMSPDDASAEARLRRLVFGSPGSPDITPVPALVTGPVRPMPVVRPAPIRPTWSIRRYGQLAAAALIVVLVGALVAAQSAGIFGNRGGNGGPTIIPAAVSQLDATPAALASPVAASNDILWTLPFEGTNVEVGASAVANDTLYRLIRSDEFTGVQAVDTTTGTEKWRSEQRWQGNGLGADENGVYLPTAGGVAALDSQTGDLLWNTVTQIAAWSLTIANERAYVWDGKSSLDAIDLGDGSILWQGVAPGFGKTTAARASQPPVVGDEGIAAMSGDGALLGFDLDGNQTWTLLKFDPTTAALQRADGETLVVTGASTLGLENTDVEPKGGVVAVDFVTGNLLWNRPIETPVYGVVVIDSVVYAIATEFGSVAAPGDPRIWGLNLEDGQSHQTTDQDVGERTWVSDEGTTPFVGLISGPNGPIGISSSGQLSFFRTDNALVQAVVSVGDLTNSVLTSDATTVYASTTNGALFALAPELADHQLNPVSATGLIDWSMPIDGQLVDFGGMTYGNGLIYRLIDTGAGREIEATYATTGQPAWTIPFDWSTNQILADPGPDPNDPAQTWTSSGNIFVVDTENRLIALNGTSGAIGWQHAFDRPVVSMVFDSGTLYVWDESGAMTAFTATDGTSQWTTTVPDQMGGAQTNDLGMPIPALTNDLIAMVDSAGTLHAFDRNSGAIAWSMPGFDGTNSRIARQGNAEWDQTEVFVVVSATSEADSNGNFDLNVLGVSAENGGPLWAAFMQGPLVQPVNTDEDKVVVTANQLSTGKNVPVDATPIVDAEGPRHYVWTSSGETDPAGGGQRIFALDAASGQIVWIRTTAAGGFTDLGTKFPEGSGWLYAITSDGLLISPARGNGSIDGEPTNLGGPVLASTSSGEFGAIGSFATLADGTLVAFGGTPYSMQG